MHSPVNASRRSSRIVAHDFGVDVVRYAFTVRDLHPLLSAGLPAHTRLTPNQTLASHSPLMFAALMIGHHFSTSAFLCCPLGSVGSKRGAPCSSQLLASCGAPTALAEPVVDPPLVLFPNISERSTGSRPQFCRPPHWRHQLISL